MAWLKGVKRNPETPEELADAAAYERAKEADASFESLEELRESDFWRAPEVLQEVDPGEGEPEEPADLDGLPECEECGQRGGFEPSYQTVCDNCAWNVVVLQAAEALDGPPESPVDLSDPKYLRHVFPSCEPWRGHCGFEVGAEVGEQVQAFLEEVAPPRQVAAFSVRGDDEGPRYLRVVSYPDYQQRRWKL